MVHRCGENSGQYLRYTRAGCLRLDCCKECVVTRSSNTENCYRTGVVLGRLCGQAIVISNFALHFRFTSIRST